MYQIQDRAFTIIDNVLHTAIKESEILNRELTDCSDSYNQFVKQMSCYLREYKSQFPFTLSG